MSELLSTISKLASDIKVMENIPLYNYDSDDLEEALKYELFDIEILRTTKYVHILMDFAGGIGLLQCTIKCKPND